MNIRESPTAKASHRGLGGVAVGSGNSPSNEHNPAKLSSRAATRFGRSAARTTLVQPWIGALRPSANF